MLELILALGLVGEAAALVWFSTSLPVGWQVVLWLQWLAAGLGLRAAGFFRVLGPVFTFDLVRSSRRLRHTILRNVYCFLLFLLLLWAGRGWELVSTTSLDPNELARVAFQFF